MSAITKKTIQVELKFDELFGIYQYLKEYVWSVDPNVKHVEMFYGTVFENAINEILEGLLASFHNNKAFVEGGHCLLIGDKFFQETFARRVIFTDKYSSYEDREIYLGANGYISPTGAVRVLSYIDGTYNLQEKRHLPTFYYGDIKKDDLEIDRRFLLSTLYDLFVKNAKWIDFDDMIEEREKRQRLEKSPF